MEDKEIELFSKTLDIIRDDVKKDIAEMKNDIRKLQEEYESVLVAQRAAKLAAEEAAAIAKANTDKAERATRKLRNYMAIFASAITVIVSLVPYIVKFLHLG